MGVTNIKFEQKAGNELDYKEEFGQVFAFDSLHWMATWRECLKKAARSLTNDGTLILAYSLFSPRIQISEIQIVAELSQLGMDTTDIQGIKSSAGTPRAFITAKKRKPVGLLIPNQKNRPRLDL